MILAVLRALAIMDGLSAGLMAEAWEPVPATVAWVHAQHARSAASDEVPAALLLAIAFKESRFRSVAGPQCGVTQIAARRDRARCLRLRSDNQYAYGSAVEHLHAWLDQCSSYGKRNIRCALTGYGRGTAAARGKTDPYALHTLRFAERISTHELTVNP